MSKYWADSEVYSQPTTESIKKNAAASKKKEKEKGKKLEPIIIEGRQIAKSWWGKSWCENLEKYADFESRLERGKRYVRTGAVIDLKVSKGKILARVQGRRKTPYKVEIRISPLSEKTCQDIIDSCSHKIENLEMLLEGKFPIELEDVFRSENGLFPASKEISFHCSCPDWALMCKHVAAVLYGVGARFDENPLLFFQLRGIDVNRFIDVTIASKVESMLDNANSPSERVIEENGWENLFGVL